jgi:threonylcarbamoyladenosine tRNA methylthiotransferase MtaB
MKVTVLTLGCRVNQSESSVIEASLAANGINLVKLNDNPDYCVVNTCSVTAKSDYTSRQLIRRAAKTGARVIVTGCYAHLNQDAVKNIDGVTALVDNTRKFDIVNIITGRENHLVFSHHSRSRPHLKVQDGCNFNCSYCTVPLARGRSKSIPAHEILERVLSIEAAGYNEVVLTGVHLGSYGLDLPKKTSLNHLIKSILKSSDIKRIRLSSLEINEVDDEFVELLQDIRLCRHIHLPLQGGSEKVLKLMRRNYTLSSFSSKINKIVSKVDNIAIGSDMIVGFPGEGDEEFKNTYTFLKSMPFTYLHIFPYSERPDTDAARMKDKIRSSTITRRLNLLMDLSREKKASYLERQFCSVLDVVIEGKTCDGYVGTSGNYIKVLIPTTTTARKGSIVIVKPLRVLDNRIEGSIIP